MTSIPVSNYGVGLNVMSSAERSDTAKGDFREVWNQQSGMSRSGQAEKSKYRGKAADETDGAREEYRVRTKKREPIRNVEERAELSKEELREVSEVLGATLEQLLQRIADRLGITGEELQEAMSELGIEMSELPDNNVLGQLLLRMNNAGEMTALVTDEDLYGTYRELMDEVKALLQKASEQTHMSEDQLKELLQQKDSDWQLRTMAPEEAAKHMAPEETIQNGEPAEESRISVSMEQPIAAEETGKAFDNRADGGASSDSDGQSKASAEDRGLHNLVLQTARESRFELPLQEVQETLKGWGTDTRDIMNQIMDYMKLNLKGDMSDVELQLHPASLGTLQIQIASKGGIVTASFVTQNEAVKTVLENQMAQLQASLQEQGVKVESIQVMVQSHGFERNLDQGNDGRQYGQEPSKRPRVRRIDRNISPEAEELVEEDLLTRSMMEADGSSVDYTA